MFHFPRLPPPGLCVQPGVTAHDRCRVAPFGNPGISLLDGSSWLIAVKPRPSSARSAKASTVRRSHLTCATPRAASARQRVPRPGCCSPGRSPPHARRHVCQRSLVCMSSEPHTYLPRQGSCTKQPACVRVSRSPPDVIETGPCPSRGGCCGRISITMSLVKAHPGARRPASRQEQSATGVQEPSLPTGPPPCQQPVYRAGSTATTSIPMPPPLCAT